MIGQIHRVWSRDNGQVLGQMVAVGEVHVEDVAKFGVLRKENEK